MSDLFGNHIVGFPTWRLICLLILATVSLIFVSHDATVSTVSSEIFVSIFSISSVLVELSNSLVQSII